MSAAISSASIANVPEPHIGSSRAPPSRAICGQPARSSSAAARFSFSGAGPCDLPIAAAMQALAGQVDRDRRAIAIEKYVDAHVGRLDVDVGSHAGRVAQLIDDRVFDALRAVQAVVDLRTRGDEVDRDRTTGMQMRLPVGALNAVVQRVRFRRVERVDLQQNPVRDAAPQTHPVRAFEAAGETDAGGACAR